MRAFVYLLLLAALANYKLTHGAAIDTASVEVPYEPLTASDAPVVEALLPMEGLDVKENAEAPRTVRQLGLYRSYGGFYGSRPYYGGYGYTGGYGGFGGYGGYGGYRYPGYYGGYGYRRPYYGGFYG